MNKFETIVHERINYEILGNTDPALHAHVIPGYSSEPSEKKRYPAFVYHPEPNKVRFNAIRDAELMNNIRLVVERLLVQ